VIRSGLETPDRLTVGTHANSQCCTVGRHLSRILSVCLSLGQNDLVVWSIFSEAGGIPSRDCPPSGLECCRSLQMTGFSNGFRSAHCLRPFGNLQSQKRKRGLVASEPVLDCAFWSQGAGVWT
jgi:hypothetical protein